MRIFYRPSARHLAGLFCALTAATGLHLVPSARAQVLAQKNWAGSGVTIEPWWRRAVFYRVDPATFQDSDGDGTGDIAGLAQRLDYLQLLGIDALILRAEPAPPSAPGKPPAQTKLAPGVGTSGIPLDGFDDLVRAAVGSHVRVLVEMGAPPSQNADSLYLAEARQWLNQGAAGIYVPTQALEKVDGAGHIALLLQQLRQLTDSFPGERVLLADAPAVQDTTLLNALSTQTQLTASAPLDATTPTAASLRQQLMMDLGANAATEVAEAPAPAASSEAKSPAAPAKSAPAKPAAKRARSRHAHHTAKHTETASSGKTTNPLLVAARLPQHMDGAQKAAVERTLATMLLVSRGAVLLEYGQELGLDRAANGQPPLMQWSPANITQKPEPPKPEPSANAGATYKGFHAFIKPLPKNLFPPPVMPVVIESDEPQAVAVDPDSVPGSTNGKLNPSLAAGNGATANVVLEQYDSRSLLSLYRQLIQLHHENATVRNGSETLLNRDSLNALVWIRHAPANSRTSATVVAACNLSGTSVALGDTGVHGAKTLVSSPPGGDGAMIGKGMVWVGAGR